MKSRRSTPAMTAAIMICAIAGLGIAPCAAAPIESPVRAQGSTGAFAGAYLRVPLSGRSGVRPKAQLGLRMGMSRIYRDAGTDGGERRRDADLLNLGFRTDGKMAFTLAGRSMLDADGRLSLKDDGGPSTGLLIAGGIVVALGIGTLIVIDKFGCSIEEDTAGECEISD